MSEFTPDGAFLRQADYGYVDRVRASHSPELVDAHIAHGLLEETSLEENLSGLGVGGLRDALKSHGLPATGKKLSLIGRVLENFSIDEIKSLPLEPRFRLTEKGKKAVNDWVAAERMQRIERASSIADLILAGEYEKATNIIRPDGSKTSLDVSLPEGIGRYLADRGRNDIGFVIGIVEDIIMGYRPPTVLSDLADEGYDVSDKELQDASDGAHTYAKAIEASRLAGKYKISSTCPCCKRMNGKTFSLEEAKIGKTLPPFSTSCMAYVSLPDL